MKIILTENTKINIIIITLSLIGFVLVLAVTTQYGLGLDYDSQLYISTARNILLGKGFLSYNDKPYIDFPPLYPMLLASLGLSGFDIIDIIKYLNAIIYGLIILISGKLFLKNLKSKTFVVLGTITILLSYPLFYHSHWARSDTIFVLLVIIFIFYFQEFLNYKNLSNLLTISLITALLCLQRYVGFALLLSGIISIFLLIPEFSPVKKAKFSLIFALASILPLTIWLIWVYIKSDTFAGRDWAHEYSIIKLNFTLNTFYVWFLPVKFSSNIRTMFLTILILILTLSFIIKKIIKKQAKTINHMSLKTNFNIILIITYTSFLILSQEVGAVGAGPNNANRFLLPVYVSTIFLIMIFFEYLNESLKKFHQKFSASQINLKINKIFGTNYNWNFSYLIAILYIIWLIYYPLPQIQKDVFCCKLDGPGGVNTSYWRKLPLIEWLQNHKLRGKIYTNYPDLLYFFNGINADCMPWKDPAFVKISPKYQTKRDSFNKVHFCSSNIRDFLSQEQPEINKYIIYFNAISGRYTYDIHEIKSFLNLHEIATFPEGSVYLMK